jgi:hypothetical protein
VQVKKGLKLGGCHCIVHTMHSNKICKQSKTPHLAAGQHCLGWCWCNELSPAVYAWLLLSCLADHLLHSTTGLVPAAAHGEQYSVCSQLHESRKCIGYSRLQNTTHCIAQHHTCLRFRTYPHNPSSLGTGLCCQPLNKHKGTNTMSTFHWLLRYLAHTHAALRKLATLNIII